MTRARWILALGTASLLAFSGAAPAFGQEPASNTPSPAPAIPPATTPSTSASAKNKKHSHEHDFLLRGTVFTPEGLAFPGAELRIRRSGEKKSRWETYTNSRGEFAVRVPQGADYEVVVRAKGFAEQSRALDAKIGREGNIVFRMEAVSKGKSGGRR